MRDRVFSSAAVRDILVVPKTGPERQRPLPGRPLDLYDAEVGRMRLLPYRPNLAPVQRLVRKLGDKLVPPPFERFYALIRIHE